jgi:hypothetical protein
MLMLGVGLGLSSVSPWSHEGIGAKALGISTIIWLSATQFVASGMGGYLAGRLRTRWADLHGDEVYFRDTAHGFLAWGFATLVTVTLMSSAIGSIIGAGAKTGAALAEGAATATTAVVAGKDDAKDGADPTAYFVDSLFRPDPAAAANPATTSPGPQAATAPPPVSAEQLGEVSRIFCRSIQSGSLTPADQQYVGSLISKQTGMAQPEAEKRVGDVFAQARETLSQAADTARKAADEAREAFAYAALWFFVSLLIGAFIASLAATFGGRQRDR